VAGNDELYMEDESYEQEINTMADVVIEEIITGITELGNETDVTIVKKQKYLVQDFKSAIEQHCENYDNLMTKINSIKVI
jgi:hypothetical protein